MIELTIDDKKVTVSKGTSVLQAARQADIHIPTLCYEPRLKPYGGCRLCIVEIKGMLRPVSSCTTPAVDGMEVTTHSDRLYRLRRTVVELLLSDHPYDCMVCTRAGDCRLQELAYIFGLRLNRFHGAKRHYTDDDQNPFIERNMAKCILCGRCVRVCNEVMGVHAIDFAYRGFTSKICPPFEKDLDCEFCGQCLSICPTGALTNRVRPGENRWMDVKYTDTVCPYCGCGCNITLHTVRDKIVGITSKPDSVNEGWLCVKGRFAHDFINSPERLKTPLIRKKKGGKLEPASWDEALDLVAERLGDIRDKHGPDALAGVASGRVTNEGNYGLQKFFRTVIGTNNIDHCARL